MISSRALFTQYMGQTSPSPVNLLVSKAHGIYVEDEIGNKYIDLIAGISVSNLGHGHPVIIDAIIEQAKKHLHVMVYGEYIQNPQVLLAQKLAALLPKMHHPQTYFVNSGSEAIEGAIKLAKRYTGRTELISFKNAYHGSTCGALSLMGGEYFKQSFRPLLPDVKQLNYNHLIDLEKITDKTAGVVVEIVQGEAGVVLGESSFLKGLSTRCKEVGALLIVDEIQTGIGRTGSFFAFEQHDFVPDILVLAKGLGFGMPLGAFIAPTEIMEKLMSKPVLGHITTFGGNPVSCAAAFAGINFILENHILNEIMPKAALLNELLVHAAIKSKRQLGLLMAIELESVEKCQHFIRIALQEGLLTDWFLFNDKSVRIAPPLTISIIEIKIVCQKIINALDQLNAYE